VTASLLKQYSVRDGIEIEEPRGTKLTSRTRGARRTPVQRFLGRVAVDPSTGCWPFRGQLTPKGYGRAGNGQAAHRYMLGVVLNRQLEPGAPVHHVCRNPACVNPAHLVPLADPDVHQELHKLEDEIRKLSLAELLDDLRSPAKVVAETRVG
jgi:hypothetical protein